MSIRQLVFRIRLSRFVRFGKNYIRDMSIRENTFNVLTVNQTGNTAECW